MTAAVSDSSGRMGQLNSAHDAEFSQTRQKPYPSLATAVQGHKKAPTEAGAVDCSAGGWITKSPCSAFPFAGLVWLAALLLQAPQ